MLPSPERRTLDARHDRFGLSTPFVISRGVKTAADVVTVTVRQGEVTGRGEGVPYSRYDESIAGSLAAIEAALTGARPSGDNAYKIELAKRDVTRALLLAAAGTPDRAPALPASVFAEPGVAAHA